LASAYVERRAREFVNAEKFKADGGADDVHDGIHGAYLVEMDLFDGHLMNLGLGFGETREDFAGAFGGAWGELRFVDAIENYGKAAVVMTFGRCDFYVRGENLAPLYSLGGNRPSFQAQFAQLGLDGAQIRAGIHQGAENHVTADAGEAIEIGVA
jgi:hypothetical protein